jgi:hypothetical protein
MLDLDAVIATKRYIKLNGRDVEIKELTTEEYLLSQKLSEDVVEAKEGEDLIKKMADSMVQYLVLVLDIDEEEARGLEYRQFRALKEHMARLDLMDQGFSEKEVLAMEKRMAKNRVEQVIDGLK